ncbi:MAG: hypothetical protein HQK51_17735 [Oligoflexia bacterium]|nr:hypothetical protein [Oligoflexia bacterium]
MFNITTKSFFNLAITAAILSHSSIAKADISDRTVAQFCCATEEVWVEKVILM